MSSGGTTTEEADEAGMGVGVKHRVNGLEEEAEVDEVEAADWIDLSLSVLDWRDLRRKGTEGIRYVGKTEERI